MPRIHVIGAPGSGKTTYARRLAAARKLPLCHLDEIFHDNSGTARQKLHRIWPLFERECNLLSQRKRELEIRKLT